MKERSLEPNLSNDSGAAPDLTGSHWVVKHHHDRVVHTMTLIPQPLSKSP
jgi:hypothetical protein